MCLISVKQLRWILHFIKITNDIYYSLPLKQLNIDRWYDLQLLRSSYCFRASFFFQRPPGNHPYVTGPIVIHKPHTQLDYSKFSSSLINKRPNIKYEKVVNGTNGALEIYNGFKLRFTNAHFILCHHHLVENVKRKLCELKVESELSRKMINTIFYKINSSIAIHRVNLFSSSRNLNPFEIVIFSCIPRKKLTVTSWVHYALVEEKLWVSLTCVRPN